MNVSAAYLAVVLIWSTTPLAIVWSSETVSPTMAVFLRMLIALILGCGLLKVKRIALPWHKQALKLYSFSAFGIFVGMLLSYFAAQFISSGLMSLVFGLAPILSGLIAPWFLNEPQLCFYKKIALVTALIGLSMVCFDNILFDDKSYIGILLIFGGVLSFSLSGVLVKSVHVTINPIATTVGALLLCTPLFCIVWLIFDGRINYQEWPLRSIYSIIYLGIFGSLFGFIAYYYILQKLAASTVALITMITPVLALTLGVLLNDERVTTNLVLGACCIVLGLSVFQWSDKIAMLRLNKKK